MINRNIASRVSSQLKAFPAVVGTGARQTGKTTLLRQLLPEYSYVTLDLPSTADLAENDPEAFFADNPAPVIIDSVWLMFCNYYKHRAFELKMSS